MSDDKRPAYHSAIAVSNIRNNIQLILDKKTVPYASWSVLFINVAKSHRVLNHIDEKIARPTGIDDEMYSQLDAAVLNWIYSTISQELLVSVLAADNTALSAWTKLKAMFHDNKSTRAVHLEREFSNCKLAAHANLEDYCRTMKSLSDQLTAVDLAPTATRLVI